MKRITSWVLTTLLILGFAAMAYSQVNVSIPNSSGDKGTTISIPVNVSDLTGLGIISYQFTVTFDENILDATGVTTGGTLSEASGWTVIPNTNADGKITVGGFGFSDMAGSGVLVYLNFTVMGNPTQTTGLDFSEFVFNGGTPTANTTGGTFTVTGTLINITVTTDVGVGTTVYVDGVQKNAPYSTQWYSNTSHTISVDQEQSGGSGIKYIYNSWSNGGSRTQTVTPTTSKTYTANLDTKYYLTVTSDHDSPQGEGWYDAGATANFSVTSPAEESGGSRYRFTQWSGDYSSSSTSGSITMNAPKGIVANWQRQYYLTTAVSPSGSGTVSPNPPGDWYDSGTNASVEATASSGYLFKNWTGDLSGSQNPTHISMNSAKSVTANFSHIVEVTVRTNPVGLDFTVDGSAYSSTQTFNWAEGSEHTLSVDSPQNGATGVRYLYSSWSDGGSQTHSYTAPGSNQTVTANFTTQYYLTVNSSHDSPQG
ncbi:MAG: hypothetical protein GXO75_17020, partial [Calditrichaeota bacterium]|nr:hypothetical protein [Calditrichota bacterium]